MRGGIAGERHGLYMFVAQPSGGASRATRAKPRQKRTPMSKLMLVVEGYGILRDEQGE